jgi:hydrogenase maturation protein HypF
MLPRAADAPRYAHVSPLEAELMSAAPAPIVLLRRRSCGIAPAVAPGSPDLGLFVPYSPLHHLLLSELGFPVVATSGNRADEPICTDEREALGRLHGIADVFLVHDRRIARPVDDSLLRVVAGRGMLVRRARGYAPRPVAASGQARSLLAVGAHLKNAVALSKAGDVLLGPHVGDLDSEAARAAFTGSIDALQRLFDLRPEAVACDAHPDYASTRWAERSGLPCVAVQHHYAHVLSGMADNRLAAPVLGVAWDGSGYGPDGTVWGGEFLRVGSRSFERVAWLRTFPLPGGERAVREPRRSALGALFELHGAALFEDPREPALGLFSPREIAPLARMLAAGLNCPRTSSAGRLFDAVAALCGLRPMSRYEGEAALALEAALDGAQGDQSYPFVSRAVAGGQVLDWGPLIEELRRDLAAGVGTGEIALRFHNTLAEMIVATALRCGERRVVLTGGCFQNRYLSERTIARLREVGLEPYWHERIPPNDGGLAVGQILAAARELQGG